MVVDKTFKAVGLAACLWAVFVMSGGHWVALQSIAWGRMLAHFSQQDSLGAAIAKTFSGKYPCSLCLKVRDGAQQEKQHEDKLPWIKTEKTAGGGLAIELCDRTARADSRTRRTTLRPDACTPISSTPLLPRPLAPHSTRCSRSVRARTGPDDIRLTVFSPAVPCGGLCESPR